MTEEKYHCRICGTEIDKERYEDHDGLCDFCEQNEEDDEDEDFGIAPLAEYIAGARAIS